MTREETKTILSTMAAVYSEKLMPSMNDLTVNVWFQLLQDLPYQQVQAATAAWLTGNKYPPTIADLRETVLARPVEASMDTAEEAWGKVQVAVRRHGWTEEERAKAALGDLIWKTVGSFGWRYWCQMPVEDESTYFAQFRNAYNVNRKREIEKAQIPSVLLEKLPGIGGGDKPAQLLPSKPLQRPPEAVESELSDEAMAFKRMILGDEAV